MASGVPDASRLFLFNPQVWRSQPVNLGVTFESAILCDISQGLSYTWTFWNSEGARVPLPPAVSTHGRTLTVPGYFLQPGNYTALAKVGDRPTCFPPPRRGNPDLSPQPAVQEMEGCPNKCGWDLKKCLIPSRHQILCPDAGRVMVRVSLFI